MWLNTKLNISIVKSSALSFLLVRMNYIYLVYQSITTNIASYMVLFCLLGGRSVMKLSEILSLDPIGMGIDCSSLYGL
jgi:hypothetical protein